MERVLITVCRFAVNFSINKQRVLEETEQECLREKGMGKWLCKIVPSEDFLPFLASV